MNNCRFRFLVNLQLLWKIFLKIRFSRLMSFNFSRFNLFFHLLILKMFILRLFKSFWQLKRLTLTWPLTNRVILFTLIKIINWLMNANFCFLRDFSGDLRYLSWRSRLRFYGNIWNLLSRCFLNWYFFNVFIFFGFFFPLNCLDFFNNFIFGIILFINFFLFKFIRYISLFI